MGIVGRDYYRKKLSRLLEKAEDEEFFVLIWATHAAQTGRADLARRFLIFPKEAATDDLSSAYAVHPWKCETLLNEILVTPKLPIRSGRPSRRLNCQVFGAIAAASNLLLSLENAEDEMILKRVHILKEMHRIAQRQFEWQHGFFSSAALYRSAFIYNGEQTKNFFHQTYEITIEEFTLTCFGLRASFLERPKALSSMDFREIGISGATRDAVLKRIAIPLAAARKKATAIRSGREPTAYKQSIFREYPCVSFEDRIIAPLPDLISVRSTSGLFYDVINGGGPVRNEVAARFEAYCVDLMKQMVSTHSVRGSFKYRIKKGNELDSPDILLCNGQGRISVVFECKARRLSYAARFAGDPVTEEPDAYEDVVKAVFQIWRFASHHRRGLLKDECMTPDAKGVILTLDTWLNQASTMQKEVLDLAKRRADSDPDITEADLIPVMFCPIEELEHTLSLANDATFIQTIDAATEERFQGWSLSNVHQQIAPEVNMNKGYPFKDRIAEVLPWWGRFGEKEGKV